MAKTKDNALRDLDDIWNGSENYADRLNAFLKLKTAAKPQTNTPFVLGGFDVSFDVDVDLVKLPPKPTPQKQVQKSPAKEQSLRETAKNDKPSPVKAVEASPVNTASSPTRENEQPPRSSANSTLRSLRRSGGACVPGSDRLRRVALHRRSRSLGRRSLLREFNDEAINLSSSTAAAPKEINNSSTNTMNFLPKTSSTPASENQARVAAVASAADPATESLTQQRHSETSMMFTQRNDPVAPVQRTYTVEMGPEPGQLLLSPTNKKDNSHVQQRPSQMSQSQTLCNRPASPLRRISSLQLPSSPVAAVEILAPNTPPRLESQSVAPREPEFTVPETQPEPADETIQQVLRSLSSSPVGTPFVVVPLANVSSKPKTPVIKVASRSIQTSCNPCVEPNLAEIMTDDESDGQRESSTAPLNLAPSGGNTSRQRRLRKRSQRVKSPNQLLDLHYSRSKETQRPRKRVTRQTVLNKPSKPPINGEQFAQELARMSNYEILDLRKRNSRGKVLPVNGNRQQLKEQQERIEWEIVRRKLNETSPNRLTSTVPLPTASPRPKSPPPSFMRSPAAPPAGFKDASVQEQSHRASPKPEQQQRRSRLRHRETSRIEKSSMSTSTAPPPNDFRDSSVHKLKTPKQSRQRRILHDPTLSEDELLAVCTPPSQFRWSKSRQPEELAMLDSDTLPEPPEQYQKLTNIQQEWTEDKETHQQNVLEVLQPAAPASPKHLRRLSRQRRKSLAVVEEEIIAIAEPPPQFHLSKSKQKNSVGVLEAEVSTKQLRKAKTTQQKLIEVKEINQLADSSPQLSLSTAKQQKMLEVQDAYVLASPPPQFRLSKSRQQKSLGVVDTNDVSKRQDTFEIVEPDLYVDPPSQFCLSKSRKGSFKVVEPTASKQQDTLPDMTTVSEPPHQSIDAVRANVENDEEQKRIDIQLNSDGKQISMCREEQVPIMLVETVLDELPSTSNATKLEASKTRKKNKKEKVPEMPKMQETQTQPADDVFKKPLAPAPRSKRRQKGEKSQRELENLRIMLANETLSSQVDESIVDPNATGVRKSRRGQVPLRNTWVHTQTDPFSFMRKNYEKSLKPVEIKPKKQSAGVNSTELFMDRPPLSSSTPRNGVTPDHPFSTTGKRKREQQNVRTEDNKDLPSSIQISGIAPLSSIVEQLEEQAPEQMEEQPQPEPQPIEEEPEVKKRGRRRKGKPVEEALPPPEIPSKVQKKRGRKKKHPVTTVETQDDAQTQGEVDVQAVPEAVPEPELEPLPHSTSTTATNNNPTDVESVPQSIDPQQDNSFPLMNWLRDVGERTVSSESCNTEEQTDALVISRASNLQFSNLNGIDYAFYNGEENYSVGYMRFKPLQVRGFNRAKRKLQFLALYGQFLVEVNPDGSKNIGPLTEKYTMNTGDLVEIKMGARYNITNCLNEVSILLINRK